LAGGVHAWRCNSQIESVPRDVKTSRAIQNRWCGLMTLCVVLLHNNVQPHTAICTVRFLRQFKWELFNHPPHSLDLATSNFHCSSTSKLS
jgi:uncharacterized membrane protein